MALRNFTNFTNFFRVLKVDSINSIISALDHVRKLKLAVDPNVHLCLL